MSDDRFERAMDAAESYTPDSTIKERVHAILTATWPRWWSPFEMEFAVHARRTPRAMREMMAADRALPPDQRKYEEKEVENTSTGKGQHKVYRALVRKVAPTLF